MTADNKQDDEQPLEYEHGIPIIHARRLSAVESEIAAAKHRDEKYRDEQLELERQQVKTNRRLAVFTGLLVLCTVVTGAISGYQAHIAKINATAARDNASSAASQASASQSQAKASEDMVTQMKSSSSDTHALAEAAKKQAEAAVRAIAFNQQEFRTEQRPWLWAEPRGSLGYFDEKGVEHPSIFYRDDKTKQMQMWISVNLTNSGKSPAIEVVTPETRYFVGPDDEMRKKVAQLFTKLPEPPIDTSLGTIVTAGSYTTPHSKLVNLTDDEYKKIVDGTWDVYVVGAAAYRDVVQPRLKRPYLTTYCFHVQRIGMVFADCGMGESIR